MVSVLALNKLDVKRLIYLVAARPGYSPDPSQKTHTGGGFLPSSQLKNTYSTTVIASARA